MLEKGLDFGGNESAHYYPAYERHSGRFFMEMRPEFWRNELGNKSDSIEILFVSPLYGLLLWDELIQEYDCYVADYLHTAGKNGITLKDFWSKTLTNVLADFIKQSERNGAPIKSVYDLLSPELFQEIFRWDEIQGVKQYHRIFKGVAGPDILPLIAKILSNHFDSFCKGRKGFDCDQWYSVPGEEGSTISFGFESKLRKNPDAWRENDSSQVRERVCEELPDLSRSHLDAFAYLVRAECSWQRLEGLKEADFGAIVVSYAKAVEAFLRGRFKNKSPDVASDMRGLRDFLQDVKRTWRDLEGDVKEMADLRDRGAHADRMICNKGEVQKAQSLAFTILGMSTGSAKKTGFSHLGRR